MLSTDSVEDSLIASRIPRRRRGFLDSIEDSLKASRIPRHRRCSLSIDGDAPAREEVVVELSQPCSDGEKWARDGPASPFPTGLHLFHTALDEQACVCRQARGGVWGVLTCLFVRYLVSLGYPLVSLWFPLETVLGTEMFLFGPRLILGGAYMLVRRHACSAQGLGNYRGTRVRMVRGVAGFM